MYKVYKRANIKTGKVYIGFTSKTIKRRWDNCKAEAKSSVPDNLLHAAINEHEDSDWKHEVLEKTLCKVEAGKKERYYIKLYKADTDGYNSYSGDTKGFTVPDFVKDKISAANKGKKRSEEYCAKQSERTSGKNNGMYGKTQGQNVKDAVRRRVRAGADQTLRDWAHTSGVVEKRITCLALRDKYPELHISKLNAVAKKLKNTKGYRIGVAHKGWRLLSEKD